ncbi:MAG TPA: S-layer homology domain-containing protein [Thermoanaerobaculia bacterium]|nr:S-layer homology domain-containing protein [Thermoanaerobaculia bacterium]
MRRLAVFLPLALLAVPGSRSARAQSTIHHTFSTPGPKSVTLTACDAQGHCSTRTKALVVLDPKPQIRSATAIPVVLGSAEAPLHLAADVAGRPPLSPLWSVTGSPFRAFPQGFPQPVADWTPDALGTYHLAFTLANGDGSVAGPSGSTQVVASSFSDVPAADQFWNAIETLRAVGLTHGCADSPPRFCPSSTVSRAEAAVFLDAANHPAPPPPPRGIFADVPPDFWAAAQIERLFSDHVTGGCAASPLRFCPADPVTRAQAAILLERARRGAGFLPPPAVGLFADVPPSHWAAPFIEQLFRDGITGGCATNPPRFCPEDTATRAQMAVFLTRTFSLVQAPIPTGFSARACSAQDCGFATGQPVHFDLSVARGIPDLYEYDWNGDGVFEQASPTPVASHSFPAVGTFHPAVRVRLGAWSATLSHPVALIIRAPDPFRAPNAPSLPQVRDLGAVFPALSDPPGVLPRRMLSLTASSAGARGFLLFAALDGGLYLYLTTVAAGSAPVSFPIPLGARSVAFQIKAFNGWGPSASSAFVNVDLP